MILKSLEGMVVFIFKRTSMSETKNKILKISRICKIKTNKVYYINCVFLVNNREKIVYTCL